MKFPIFKSQFSNKNQTKTKNNLSNTSYRAVCILALFLMAIIFIPSENQLGYAMSDEEYNQQTNDLNNQKNETNKNLQGKQLESRTLSDELKNIDNQIAQIQSQINNTQYEIDLINKNVEDINSQIINTEQELGIKKESLNEYLRVIYEDSNTSTIELIASSNNFSDFIDKTEYNLTMQGKIRETVASIKQLKKDLENKKTELVQKRQGVEDLKVKQVAQRQAVDAQYSAKDNLLKTTKGQESNYKAHIAKLQEEIDAIDAAYIAAKKSGSSGDSTYTGGGSGDSGGGNTGGGDVGQGYLSWPSGGGVYQEWGWTDLANGCFYRFDRVCKIHNGIDISTGSTSTSIKAAADGKVIDTGYGYSGGWGNWVAIQHTGSLNGLVTFYAHLSSISVSPGQQVTRGQKIGNEGNTGISLQGAVHLHFSVYTSFKYYNTSWYHGPDYDGTVNPRDWLR